MASCHSRWSLTRSFIAAILTVVGYSINDTVVVFDRIREYVGLQKKRERKEIFNSALNSTLSRTFSTSLSTFFVLLAIFIFGGDVIRGFIFALLAGCGCRYLFITVHSYPGGV